MRSVFQRVRSAHVSVDGEIVGRIDKGILAYVGVGQGDTERDVNLLVQKVVGARIFENEAGKMDLALGDIGGALLVVSQFTLFGDMKKGRRPSFEGAMPPGEAERLYELFVAEAKKLTTVATGTFRAHMHVVADNDGPITLLFDTAEGRTS